MEKIISYKDIEDTIFSNPIIHKDLPQYKNLFDSYALSRMSPSLRNLGQRSILLFMNSVTIEECKIISKILGYQIKIKKMEFDLIKDIVGDTNNIEFGLNQIDDYNELVVYRKKDEVKVLCWK